MAENCSIYCRVKRPLEVRRLAGEFFGSSEIAGAPHEWRTVEVGGKSGYLRLTSKWFQERGDEFCRLLLSTCASIERISGIEVSQRKQLTSRIEQSKLVLGVVADPSFEADALYSSFLFDIADMLDGVLFTGNQWLDSQGQTIARIL